jgi:hypothetical protein
MKCVGALLMTALLMLAAPVQAQRANQAPLPALPNDPVTHFYDDPKPENLTGLLDKVAKSPAPWDMFPPLVGFYAALFNRHPDWIDKLLPETFDGRSADTIAAAWKLSERPPMAQSLRTRIEAAGHDPALHAVLADLPDRLADIRITIPTHMDILWGAFFATGDPAYAGKVLDFFGQMANRSDSMALDITAVTLAMTGGPKEPLQQIRTKYGDNIMRAIVYASTAEWGVLANARQHPIVAKTLDDWLAAHADTAAAKSLATVRASGHH